MLLIIDNYDSFTYNLKDYFEQLGQNCWVVRNDAVTIRELKQKKITRIVISPGPQRPQNAGIVYQVLEEFYTQLPILGICLGHQAIGEFFGATLEKAAYPMHGKVSEITHLQEGIFCQLPSPFKVCRYHSLVITNTQNTPLQVTAKSLKDEIMALQHNNLPIFGVQFHPEAILSQYGIQLLKNWISI